MNKESNFRSVMRRSTFLVGSIIIFAFFYIIIKGLFWTPYQNQQHTFKLTTGKTELKRLGKQRFWISHFSDYQLEQLKSLDPWLKSTKPMCDKTVFNNTELNSSSFCAISAKTNHSGILIRFITDRPLKLNTQAIWLSGFVDPTTGNIFDLMGRQYKQAY